MEEAIRNFHTQFSWKPVIVHKEKLPFAKEYIVVGMGGSHLSADLIKTYDPNLDIGVYSDYGLPPVSPRRLRESLLIASSYSGNTEEPIDFLRIAKKKGYGVAAMGIGGTLIELSRRYRIPHVVIPDTKIQPRSALGFSMSALATLMRHTRLASELRSLATVLTPDLLEREGKKLAKKLKNSVPVIYASAGNRAVAYNWKIKFNETGKIPAFYNVFPELNHNEMTGFDLIPSTTKLSSAFHFIFLTDTADHPKNQKRMAVCKKLYEKHGLPVTQVALQGKTALERMFHSLLVADWTALHLSKMYRTEAEQVPMVEEFKKLIA